MDFFVAHGGTFAGIILLLALATIPRITMAAMLIWGALTGGGFWWWLGFLFTPYILLAVEASSNYWQTNPGLCICAWIAAIFGTLGEGSTVKTRSN